MSKVPCFWVVSPSVKTSAVFEHARKPLLYFLPDVVVLSVNVLGALMLFRRFQVRNHRTCLTVWTCLAASVALAVCAIHLMFFKFANEWCSRNVTSLEKKMRWSARIRIDGHILESAVTGFRQSNPRKLAHGKIKFKIIPNILAYGKTRNSSTLGPLLCKQLAVYKASPQHVLEWPDSNGIGLRDSWG